MRFMFKICSVLIIFIALLAIGCTGFDNEVVIVQTKGTSSFDFSKGVVYDIDVWVKNEGSSSHNARVTANLISNTDEIRDSLSKTITLQPGEKRNIEFTLDGESGVDYNYRCNVEQL
ncbi:hypothetical protein Mmah_0456 [Methanohalophilus mahii DSM 5219]|uniref:CARDB domain-containing protein n=2 Tax=Methanohalophilus mahii TaxID=2176 RepID=D5E9Y5_METMS|nr:hypothetical protein Mmah_0456 [Methanohalophilus mahii DSM 5219]